MNSIFAKVEKLSGDFLNEMIQNRRFIHQNPELSTKEFETAKFVKKSLEEIGILDVKTLEIVWLFVPIWMLCQF